MGSYGIGVPRTMQAIAEQRHDQNGIKWPVSVAPYTVLIQLLEVHNEVARKAAEKAYQDLQASGIDVLLDDRDERPGVKFKDGDLLGIPFQVRFGKKFLENGKIEIKNRITGVASEVAATALVSALSEAKSQF